MSDKQMAVLRTADDDRYRLMAWNDRAKSRTSHPKWPATIHKHDGDRWRVLDQWELYEGTYELPSDGEILARAVKRLELMHNVEIAKIFYDDYDGEELPNYDSAKV